MTLRNSVAVALFALLSLPRGVCSPVEASQPAEASGQDSAAALSGAEGLRLVTFDEALAAASANDDVRILEGNLASARALHALNTSKNLPTLSGGASWSLSDGFSDLAQAKSAGASGLGIGQVLQGSLTFAEGNSPTTSGTRLGLTLTHNLPATPQEQSGKTVDIPSSTSLAFSLSQGVWDGYPGGQAKAGVDKSLLTLQGKELAARQSRSAAAAKVKQAYVTTLVAQRTLSLRLGNLDKQRSLLKQVEATFELRQASAIDLQTAKINVRGAELDVETSRHDYALARQRLANLVGLPSDAAFRVAEIDEPGLPAATLEEAIAKGVGNRVDLAQLDLTARSSRVDAALALAAAEPVLTATGGLNASFNRGTSASSATQGQSVSLGLRLSLPILDAGAAKAQAASAKASIDVAAIQAAGLAKSVAAEIRDDWWTVTILAERIGLARQSFELASSQLALVRDQLRFGAATTQDLLNSSVNAANAEAAWLKARSDQLLAVLALETAMGL